MIRTLAMHIAGRSARAVHEPIPLSEYYLDVLAGAAESAADNGCALTPTFADADLVRLGPVADGAVIVDPVGDDPLLARAGVVTIGWAPGVPEGVPAVVSDHAGAAAAAMDHLYAKGYSRPMALVSERAGSRVQDMLDGYVEWMNRHGRSPGVVDLESVGSMTGALDLLLAAGGDAVYAGSDHLALNVAEEARRRGIVVPDQLGVCSAVDSSILRGASPQLTGVFLNPRELGRRAVDLLIRLLDGKIDCGEGRHQVPIELVVRASTLRSGTPPTSGTQQ